MRFWASLLYTLLTSNCFFLWVFQNLTEALGNDDQGYVTMTLNATAMCAADSAKPPTDMVLLSVADLANDKVLLMYGTQDILLLASNLAMGPITNPRPEARLEDDFEVTKKVNWLICINLVSVYGVF